MVPAASLSNVSDSDVPPSTETSTQSGEASTHIATTASTIATTEAWTSVSSATQQEGAICTTLGTTTTHSVSSTVATSSSAMSTSRLPPTLPTTALSTTAASVAPFLAALNLSHLSFSIGGNDAIGGMNVVAAGVSHAAETLAFVESFLPLISQEATFGAVSVLRYSSPSCNSSVTQPTGHDERGTGASQNLTTSTSAVTCVHDVVLGFSNARTAREVLLFLASLADTPPASIQPTTATEGGGGGVPTEPSAAEVAAKRFLGNFFTPLAAPVDTGGSVHPIFGPDGGDEGDAAAGGGGGMSTTIRIVIGVCVGVGGLFIVLIAAVVIVRRNRDSSPGVYGGDNNFNGVAADRGGSLGMYGGSGAGGYAPPYMLPSSHFSPREAHMYISHTIPVFDDDGDDGMGIDMGGRYR